MTAEVFEPVRLRSLELANRLVMAPVKTTLGGVDGLATPRHVAYDPLSEPLRAAGLEVEVIGDALRPGRILDATRAGREAAVAAGEE